MNGEQMPDGLLSHRTRAAVVWYRPQSHAAKLVDSIAEGAQRARAMLAGFGSEKERGPVSIFVLDAFPSPAATSALVTSGTVVDPGANEIWMVGTAESPPERLERPMAVLFGAASPVALALPHLINGYGLFLAGFEPSGELLHESSLLRFAEATGELSTAMDASFVKFLIEREGETTLRQFVATAEPSTADEVARDLYGAGLAKLEAAWRKSIVNPPSDVKPLEFARLAARYLRPHWRRELEVVAYMLLALLFTMTFPFATRHLLDSAIPSGDFSQVAGIIGLLGVVLAVSLISDLRRTYVSTFVSGSVVQAIRAEVFSRLQRLSASWHDRQERGDILSRLFSDVGLLERGLSSVLIGGLYSLISLVTAVAVLMVLNPVLGTVVLVGAPAVAFVYRGMATGARQRSLAVQERSAVVLDIAQENLAAQKEIRAFGLAAREESRFYTVSDRLLRSQLRLQLYSGIFGLSVNVIVTTVRLAVLAIGSWLILNDRLTIGGLVAVLSVVGEVLNPVAELTGLGQQLQASSGALVRINEITDSELDIVDEPDATALSPLATGISLSAVNFAYTPGHPTITDLNLDIPAGKRVALVGPSGAGKSTVLQLIMRSYDPESGSVQFDGQDLRAAQLDSLKEQIGVVFQETFLFDTSIRDNIAAGKMSATEAEIVAAAKAAEIHDHIAALPAGYDSSIGENGVQLSGGQRQRLAIARALLRDPAVLILDEATSSLDPKTAALISEKLYDVGAGRTTVAVTHRLASVTDYDIIFVLVAGRLVEQGTHEELLANGGQYASLWAEQANGSVTGGTPIDAVTALAAVPFFADLARDDLAAIASQMRPTELPSGQRIDESIRQLVLVMRGRALVLLQMRGGHYEAVADLEDGDAYGISALMGHPNGTVLEADGAVGLLILDSDQLDAIASEYPSVAQALDSDPAGPGPSGGTVLARVSTHR